MTLIRPVDLGSYYKHVKGLKFSPGLLPIEPTTGDDFSTAFNTRRGCNVLDFQFVFKDKSRLQITESLLIEQNQVTVTAYTYHYERPSGFFITYEMEFQEHSVESTTTEEPGVSSQVQSIYKPHQHMHIGILEAIADELDGLPPQLRGHDGPHYYSPQHMHWERVLALVLVNFCKDSKTDLSEALSKLKRVPLQIDQPTL